MKTSTKTLAIMTIVAITMTGCSTQHVKPDVAEPVSEDKAALELSKKQPDSTVMKAGKTLNLVRVLDGAVCKNDQQGALGEFLLYADPLDIDRIKQQKGEKIFHSFEQKIERFSAQVFESVINTTSMSEDPFALGEYEANQKLAKQVASSFKSAVADEIDKFQQETSLTIDITAFPAAFTFYRTGCDINKMNIPE
jgi:hypothetical protein